MEKQEWLQVYRHSLSHILAKAVIELFGRENVQYAIGPQIADGFYYDFALPRPVAAEDYKAIENKMREILKRREDWTRLELSRQQALELFAGQKYKTELITELPEGETITAYRTGEDFVDLCRGPHVDNSKELMSAAFQIKAASSAYWRGDEHNDVLTRIYVYAFPTKEELKAHLNLIREAQERDHKRLGPQLDLFMFSDTAPGMPYWLPRGWAMYQALVRYWRMLHVFHGYQEISAPIINSQKLWVTSGHWDHYQNNMFLIPGDKEGMMAIKPMNCPNAIQAYKRTLHSYKELPIRYNELDVIHRKEKSGQLNGLFRVQAFRQDDAHTFITEGQIESEIGDVMSIADEIYKTFGIRYRAELSTRPDDFMGDIAVWEQAEAALRRILDSKYGEGGYTVNEGDGAFYGPKIDLKMNDALGREWQCGTIQLDFQLPRKFELTYQDRDGLMKQPVMIHRAIFGSLERFIGIIIEHFKGAFPFWMSPYQVAVVPIRVEHNDYARKVADALMRMGIRVEADYADKNMNEKIKVYRTMKDPYILVIGDREVETNTVSITVRGQKQQLHDVPLETLYAMVRKMEQEHTLELLGSVDQL